MGACLSSYPDSRIVDTEYGKVQGRKLVYEGDKQVDAFQGIPFAKSPIGPLRFKKPVPPEKWDDVKKTKRFSKSAVQAPVFSFLGFLMSTSEDCLYLNVFTPCWKPPPEGFPVMVFIHGGAFVVGDASAHGDRNICENIVKRDVIFITVQYRLAYLGFMTTDDEECRGNLGLCDQTAALRWINENIEAFGGNKNNITVIGQSAGGISVDMLHLSPHSTDLFHKMVPMAGNSEMRGGTYKKMPEQCRKKAEQLGITDCKNSKELLDKLRSIPAKKLTVNAIKMDTEKDNDFETVPYIDGDFFPAPLDELRKRATPKPMMTGVTKEEGTLLLYGKKRDEAMLKEAISLATRDAADRDKLAASLTDDIILVKRLSQQELRLLYGSDDILKNKDNLTRALAKVYSDYFFNAPTLELCRKTIDTQGYFDFGRLEIEKSFRQSVYLYVFDHYNSKVMGLLSWKIPKIQEATHGSELFFLFNKGFFGRTPSLSNEDKVVMASFTDAFTNFAKYGNPNGSDSSKREWLPIDMSNFSRNFVFTNPKNYMSEEYFEGRPAKFVESVAKHRSS